MITAPSAPGSITSRQAALAIAPDAAEQRETVMRHIQAAGVGGLTRKEIEAVTGLSGDSVRPRCWELLGNGGHPQRVSVSDEIRRSPKGRPYEVLVAVEFAR